LFVTAGDLARLVANAGGAIDGYGALLAFPPRSDTDNFDVELSHISHCIVNEARRRVTLYPTMEGYLSDDEQMLITIEVVASAASSLIEDRSDYSVHMCRRLVSVDPLRGAEESLVRGTVVVHPAGEVWLLSTEDRDWALRAAAL
jgi:hypothetical protein